MTVSLAMLPESSDGRFTDSREAAQLTVSLAMLPESPDGRFTDSREAAQPPQLVIRYRP